MKIKLPKQPTCPFCESAITKPVQVALPYVDHEVGSCNCGAVYALSITGFDRGATFLSALLFAVGGDWDLAWDLDPEVDYQETWLEGYDHENHLIVPNPVFEEGKIRSALVFIRVADDVLELRKVKLIQSQEKEQKIKLDPSLKKRLKRIEIEDLILGKKFPILLNYLLAEPINLRELQKLLYHPEERVRKLTSYTFGLAAKHLQKFNPLRIVNLIKDFLYASADTASSAWGALEAVGEIIRETGNQYALYLKNLLAFLAFKENIPSVLSALARISEKNPKALKSQPYLRVIPLFREGVPLWQAYLIQIFLNLKGRELLSEKRFLLSDEVPLFDWEEGEYKMVSLNSLWELYERQF